MPTRPDKPTLRQRAEEKQHASPSADLASLAPDQAQRLVHELQVHQIELEMQNDELRRTQESLELARAQYFDLYDLAPVGYVTLDEHNLILQANLRATTLLGVARGDLVRQPLSHFIVPQDQESYYLCRRQLSATGEPQVCELQMRHEATGELIWIQLEITLGQDDETQTQVCRAILQDITQRKRLEKTLRESEAKFRGLIEQSSEGILLISPQGIIVEWNEALTQLTGIPRADALGKFVWDVQAKLAPPQARHTLTSEQFRAITIQALENEQVPDMTPSGEIMIHTATGETKTLLQGLFGVHGQNGYYLGVIVHDITERKRTETALAAKNNSLALLYQLSQTLNQLAPLPAILERISDLIGQVFDNRNLYIALYDEATNYVSFPIYWVQGDRKYIREGRPLSNGLTEFVIRSRAPLLISDHVREALAERNIALIGTLCECYLGVPILQDDHVLGVMAIQDYERANMYDASHVELLTTIASQAAIAITNARLYETVQRELLERQQAEVALRQAKSDLDRRVRELEQNNLQMRLLAEMGNLLQVCRTTDEVFAIVQRYAAQLFPHEPGALFLSHPTLDLVEAKVVWGHISAEEQVFATQDCMALRRHQARVYQPGQSEPGCRHIKQPVERYICLPLSSQNKVIGLLHLLTPSASATDQTDATVTQIAMAQTFGEQFALAWGNIKLQEILREQAVRDPLTQLYNPRYLNATLPREIALALRKDYGIGVLMLDLDHFKNINDTYGHSAGDETLEAVARALTAHLRASDIICRYGGEEFLCLLMNTTQEFIWQRAEELRAAIADLPIVSADPHARVTVSIGVALLPPHGSNMIAILKAADAALYQAKVDGRNCVRLAQT